MAKGFQIASSGPIRLIWDRTGYPITPDGEPDPGAVYHLASKIEPFTLLSRPADDSDYHQAVFEISSQVNNNGRIPVGAEIKSASDDIRNSIEGLPAFVRNRKSTRAFSGMPVTQLQLGTMLAMAFSDRGRDRHSQQRRRVVASPGGLFSIDTYILCWNIDGISEGLYFVDSDRNALRVMKCMPVLDRCKQLQFTIPVEQVGNAAGMIALTFVPERLQWKYGVRSFRYGYLEAGHLMHAVSLGASLSNIGLCPLGGFCDALADELLGVDGNCEMTVYLALFGTADSHAGPLGP